MAADAASGFIGDARCGSATYLPESDNPPALDVIGKEIVEALGAASALESFCGCSRAYCVRDIGALLHGKIAG
jgi:hypothetical protein